MTVDMWIRDYDPPRCFQKKISGRGKRNEAHSVLTSNPSSIHQDFFLLFDNLFKRQNLQEYTVPGLKQALIALDTYIYIYIVTRR
jgi:hypothetical protein